MSGLDCDRVDCPECGKPTWIADPDPRAIHLIVSYMNGKVWVKPSRPCPAWKVVDMLKAAKEMVYEGSGGIMGAVVTPDECELQAWITVDEDASEDRAKEFLE